MGFIGVPLFALGLIAMSWSVLAAPTAATAGISQPAGEDTDGRAPNKTPQDA